jgi:hypothetical protein
MVKCGALLDRLCYGEPSVGTRAPWYLVSKAKRPWSVKMSAGRRLDKAGNIDLDVVEKISVGQYRGS